MITLDIKQRLHRSKSGTTDRDFQTASVSPMGGTTARVKGFTLVELVVVMAMTAIMIAVTITSLSGARDKKAVEAEARKFAATIREMQNYALTGKVFFHDHDSNPATDPIPRVVCGVGIDSIDVDNSTYLISYPYRTGTSCADSPEFSELPGVNNLSNGVRFSSTTDAFYFRVPRGDLMNRSSVAITTPRLIVLHKNTADYSVCVYPGGGVTETVGVLGSCP